MIWTGLPFTVLHHRDGRFLHLPGLFAFARRDLDQRSVLLFAGHAEDLAQETACSHPQWSEALKLGMSELHVHFPVCRRIDRLQLLTRVIRHTQPLLNVLEEVHPRPSAVEPSRSCA